MIKLKMLGIFAACIVMTGCMPEYFNAKKQELDTPVRVTIRVLDENGQPIPDTVALVKQYITVGEKLFCVSLLGKNCEKYWIARIFKGDVGSDGEVSFDVKYPDTLMIFVANPCRDPKGYRRYFYRSVSWEVFSQERVIIQSNVSDRKNGFSVNDSLCETTTPPLKNWDDFF